MQDATQYERLNDAAYLALEAARRGQEGEVDPQRVADFVPRARLPTVRRVEGWRFIVRHWSEGEWWESGRLEYPIAQLILREKLEDAEDLWRPR